MKGLRRGVLTAAAVPSITVSFLTVSTLAGCNDATPPSSASAKDQIGVTAAFYPLQYAVEQVGGGHVHVVGLTKPGAEPHELELTPRQVAEMTTSSVVIYEKGFQPAVDDAVASIPGAARFDISSAARLTLPASEEAQDQGLSADPHFWLDPTRYADVVTAIGSEFAKKDPTNATAYQSNADVMVAKLEALDADVVAGLAHCASNVIVTGHAAFGYLAERYRLTQVSVSGISPDIEPTATQMSSIVSLIKARRVRTVYAETLVSPALVETLARESGAAVKVLDPIEGITKQSAGSDYFEVMRANLVTLREGQQCT